jgi:hypothetical protein
MVLKRTNFEKAEQSNSSIKLKDNSNTEVNNKLANKQTSVNYL